MFSVTYLFGGVFVYSKIYGLWYLLILVLALGLTWALIPKILAGITSATSEEERIEQRGNLLLNYFRRVSAEREFQSLVEVYLFIYFLLLVVELLVTRLMFEVIFPDSYFVKPLIMGFFVLDDRYLSFIGRLSGSLDF